MPNLLFDDLPQHEIPMPADEQALLAELPDDGSVAYVPHYHEAACVRLQKRGLVVIHRWKDDPIAMRATMYAGRPSKL